jgi:signal recognition particle subunit SRP54
VQEVNKVLKQQLQMSKMMKKMAKGGMAKMMRAMGGKLPMGGGPMGGM